MKGIEISGRVNFLDAKFHNPVDFSAMAKDKGKPFISRINDTQLKNDARLVGFEKWYDVENKQICVKQGDKILIVGRENIQYIILDIEEKGGDSHGQKSKSKKSESEKN